MPYLALHVLCLVLFSQGLRWMQHRAAGLWRVVAWNYLLCALLAGGAFLGSGAAGRGVCLPAAGLGIFAGMLYVLHLHVILRAYRQVGVGVTFALMAVGSAPPAVFAWLVWDEALTAGRVAALLLLPLSAVLLRPVRGGDLPRHLTLRDDLVLLGVFGISAGINLSHKAAAMVAGGEATRLYMAVLFGTTMLCSWAVVRVRKPEARPADKRFGFGLGLANVLATTFALLALRVLPAAVFFPVAVCGIITINLLLGWRLWGERIARRQVAGVLAAVGIVVLANL